MSHVNFKKNLGVKGHICGSEIGKEYSLNSKNRFNSQKEVSAFLLADSSLPNS